MSPIQSIRTTEEVFIPDAQLRELLHLHSKDIILDVRRASVGYGKRQQLDLAGLIITVLRGKGQ